MSFLDITGSLPWEFNFISIDICTLSLAVNTLDNVSICKVPAALALRLVKTEVTLEESSVGVDPLAWDNQSVFEFTNVFFACFVKDICALSIFLSAFPFSRVNILVSVSHDSFSMAFSIFPVAIVLTLTDVVLSSDAWLSALLPRSFVLDLNLFGTLWWISVNTFTFTMLIKIGNCFSFLNELTPSTKSPSYVSPFGYWALPFPVNPREFLIGSLA